jgi:capsular polysaccharide biosynthesis protein
MLGLAPASMMSCQPQNCYDVIAALPHGVGVGLGNDMLKNLLQTRVKHTRDAEVGPVILMRAFVEYPPLECP